jgi:hypothetical protein
VLPLKVARQRPARCVPALAKTSRRYWLGDSLNLALDPLGPTAGE